MGASGAHPNEQHFLGLRHGVQGRACGAASFSCRAGTLTRCNGPGWVCGGPGVLISHNLARGMKTKDCPSYYRNHWPYQDVASDVALACCAYDAMGSSYHVEDIPGLKFDSSSGKEDDAIAIHHISPSTVEDLGAR